jgi:hypothetical protein
MKNFIHFLTGQLSPLNHMKKSVVDNIVSCHHCLGYNMLEVPFGFSSLALQLTIIFYHVLYDNYIVQLRGLAYESVNLWKFKFITTNVKNHIRHAKIQTADLQIYIQVCYQLKACRLPFLPIAGEKNIWNTRKLRNNILT